MDLESDALATRGAAPGRGAAPPPGGEAAGPTADARPAAALPQVTLYDWAPSPFCIKVRAILDHKRIPYRRVPALAPAAWWRVWRAGKVGKVPAIEIDGRLVTDSTDIAYALDELVPQPPLLPQDPHERAMCHVLEDWCDEALYFIALHYHWVDAEGAPQVARAFGRSLLGRAAYRWYRALIRRQLRGQGTGRKPPARIAADRDRELDAVEGLLQGRAYLLGSAPLLCDFALLGQLLYWSRAPQTGRALQSRPAIVAYLARMKALGERSG